MGEAAVLATAILAGAALVAGADTADKIHIRDPFVVVDREKGCYCLLSSCFAPPGERGNDFFAFLGTGAKIYESKDLVNWSEARQVLTIPDWVGCRALWAPELHQFRGKWYILGTVNGADNRRGTWTFVSENLRGPYRPTGRRSITPPEWLALDGTLWVESANHARYSRRRTTRPLRRRRAAWITSPTDRSSTAPPRAAGFS